MGLSMWTTQQKNRDRVCALLGALVKRIQTRCYSEESHILRGFAVERHMGRLGSVVRNMERAFGMERLGRVWQCWQDRFTVTKIEAVSARCLFTTVQDGEGKRQRQAERKRESQRRAGCKPIHLWQRSLFLLAAMAEMGDTRANGLPLPVSPIEQGFHDAGDGNPFAQCLQRKGDTRGSPSLFGQSRKGIQQEQHQIFACCYKELGLCTESSQRCGHCEEGAQTAVDKACWRRNQSLGGATRKLSGTSGVSGRACCPCSFRDRSSTQNSQGSQREQYQRGQSLNSTAYPRGERGSSQREQRRPRGAEIARSASGGIERMCRLTRPPISSSRDIGSLRRGKGTSSPTQAAKIGGASQARSRHCQTVTYGRESPVLKNGTHVAWPYMFPTGHSVTSERNYSSPFSSVWSAWKLRGEVLQDGVEQQFSCGSDLHNDRGIDHVATTSILSSSQGPHCRRTVKSHVCFDDRIELAFSLEDGHEIYRCYVDHNDLQEWNTKPWMYLPSPATRRFSWRKLTNFGYPFCDFYSHCEVGAEEAISRLFCTVTCQPEDASLSGEFKGCLAHIASNLTHDIKRIVGPLLSSTSSSIDVESFSVRIWTIDCQGMSDHTAPRMVQLSLGSSNWFDIIFKDWIQDFDLFPYQIHVIPAQKGFNCKETGLADVVLVSQSCRRSAVVDVYIGDMFSSSFAVPIDNVSITDLFLNVWQKCPDHSVGVIALAVCEGGEKTLPDNPCIRIGFVLQDHFYLSSRNKLHELRPVLQDITNLPYSKSTGQTTTGRGAPLSLKAVLSSCPGVDDGESRINVNVDLHRNHEVPVKEDRGLFSDEISLMQTPKAAGILFKNAPADLQHRDLVQTFQTGQVGNENDESDFEVSSDGSSHDGVHSQGSFPEDAHPPSSSESRQDVILFHLDDHPIRVMVNWNSYEEMITEIAHHYGLTREDVIDVYEVIVSPPDIGMEVVPTIVHVIGDLPQISTDRLVLIDVEYHAHRIEDNFRSGPNVLRSVRSLPITASREDVLHRANVDRYCRYENGRCLVFINSRRWPDYDGDRKTLAHGDYIRIAVPPSEHFACPTNDISDMVQRRLSDQQIYDEIFNDEAASGFSPSPLTEAEVRRLAPENGFDDDSIAMMQNNVSVLHASHSAGGGHISDSSDESVPEDWFIDLQRMVETHFRSCDQTQQDDFMFSIYTWFIDQETSKHCKEPKIAILGDDPAEWKEDILLPWQYHIVPGNSILIDLVKPVVPRAVVEDHIAHVIITQRPIDLQSILFSLELVDPLQPSVVFNAAVAVPKISSARTIADSVPLFASFYLNERNWVHPNFGRQDRDFETRFGMGVHVQILTGLDQEVEDQADEVSALMIHKLDIGSVASGSVSVRPTPRIESDPEQCWTSLKDLREAAGEHNAVRCIEKFARSVCSHRCITAEDVIISKNECRNEPTSFSLTEEFLRFVQAVGSAEVTGNAPVEVPAGLTSQPVWVQDLWEKWVETMMETGRNPDEGLRLETWFNNPRRWSRCREPRIVVLSQNFLQWEHELLSAWPDKADRTLPAQFAIVFPTPADADASVQEQVIIEQESEAFSRSVVVTVYDTHIDGGSPHSISLVVSDRLYVSSLITLMDYAAVCPPERDEVECLMWMGNVVIHPDQVVNVRLGNAFRLLVRRGIRVTVQELLSMSDARLRVELQSAISGVVYRRPNLPGFPADAYSNNNPETPQAPAVTNSDYPPEWLNMLQERFDRQVQNGTTNDHPHIHVVVWFLNSGSFLRNQAPQVVRLDAESSWWRSELIFPWREHLQRGLPIDLHCVDPEPPSEGWHSHAAHVIISQALPTDHVPILATVVSSGDQSTIVAQAALVVHRFSSSDGIVNRFSRELHTVRGLLVRRGRNVFPEVHTVRLGPGDGLTVQNVNHVDAGRSAGSSSSGLHRPLHDRGGAGRIDSNVGLDPEDQDEDHDDAFLMQRFVPAHSSDDEPNVISDQVQTPQCAVEVPGEVYQEANAFQFNPAAIEFQPNAYVLPAWAQVIEDIYHDWDAQAFSWQGESRVAHFMTWYLAPGVQRVQCLYGRRIALMADFWNWRESFKRVWIDEIDPVADFELVYVSPPPTQLEPGIAGHVIVLQHNSVEWSSFLLSVFDPAINGGHSFHMAQAFTEQLQFQDITARIGYGNECANHAQCQFRVRGQLFQASAWFRASDGDAIDLLVHRVVVPNNWYPPFLPHMPGAEGLALLQTKAAIKQRVNAPKAQQGRMPTASCSAGLNTISLHDAIEWDEGDVQGIQFSLNELFSQAGPFAHDLVVCVCGKFMTLMSTLNCIKQMTFLRRKLSLNFSENMILLSHALISSRSIIHVMNGASKDISGTLDLIRSLIMTWLLLHVLNTVREQPRRVLSVSQSTAVLAC